LISGDNKFVAALREVVCLFCPSQELHFQQVRSGTPATVILHPLLQHLGVMLVQVQYTLRELIN